MSDKTKLSFIIVNYRSKRYLKKCVVSLFNKIKDVNFEIIIVNNDENDLIELENAKIINLKKNVGFGKANNIGAQKAVGEFLCFLNPDTIILSENIGKIIKEFKRNSVAGIIGPRLIGKFNETQWWCAGVEITLWDLIKNNLGFKKSRRIWESRIKKEADWVSGAALFIPRPLFLKLGGFDENFFMYFEDVDLCRRAKELGKKIIYFPEVKIKHWGGKSNTCEKNQKKEYYESQDYYFKKYHGRLIGWAVRVLRRIAVKQ